MSKKKSRVSKRGGETGANDQSHKVEADLRDLKLDGEKVGPPILLEQENQSNSNGTGQKPHSTSSVAVDNLDDGEGDEEQLPTWIEVKDTEGKGQAVFAIRKIKPGTLILAEPPLIRLTQKEEDKDKDDKSGPTASSGADMTGRPVLEQYFDDLPRAIQKSYLKLFDSRKSGFSRVKSIYYSNCYNLSTSQNKIERQGQQIQQDKSFKQSPGGSAIGQTASRINHSCVPNVQFSFDETTQRMLFHAIKPIPRGREIVSSYDTVYEIRATRQRKQQLYYGFQCDCEACQPQTDFWMKSDDRRKAMIEAKRDLRSCEKAWDEHHRSRREEQKQEDNEKKEPTDDQTSLHLQTSLRTTDSSYPGPDPIYALERLESLLIKEGLVGLPLADIHRDMSKWAERKGDVKRAKLAKKKELEICKACLGEKSTRVENVKMKIELLVC